MSGPYRDGEMHVLSRMCATCIFRPGNLMHLEPGRVEGMIAEATENETAIHCHSTLYRDDVDRAVCRGFFDKYPTFPLRLAAAMDIIVEDPPPRKESKRDPRPNPTRASRHDERSRRERTQR